MNILVTNDDGILAPALQALKAELSPLGRVVIVAPDRDQSATSHSLTLHRPFRIHAHEPDVYSVDGTPTDCVLLGIGVLLPEKPSFVFSGVNHGPNMGEDVLYSGTVSAAMEAVTLGVPGIAFSFAGRDPELMHGYRDTLVRLVRRITSIEDFPPGCYLDRKLE